MGSPFPPEGEPPQEPYPPGGGPPQGPYPPGGGPREPYPPGGGPREPYPPGGGRPREPYPPGGGGPREPYPPGGERPGEYQPPWTPPPPAAPLPALAGRWRRLFAGILDAVIIAIITSPLTYSSWNVAADPETGTLARVNLALTFLAALIGFLYYWLLQAFWNGQTLGKKLFGMRVVQETGQRITVGQTAIRQLVMLVLSWLCCLWIVDLGFILFDPRKQALHDKAAKTLVVDA